jgi:hypothetical protein
MTDLVTSRARAAQAALDAGMPPGLVIVVVDASARWRGGAEVEYEPSVQQACAHESASLIDEVFVRYVRRHTW